MLGEETLYMIKVNKIRINVSNKLKKKETIQLR